MGLLDMFSRKPTDPDAWYNSINPGLLSQMTGMNAASDPTYGLLSSQNKAYQANYPVGQDDTADMPSPSLPQTGATGTQAAPSTDATGPDLTGGQAWATARRQAIPPEEPLPRRLDAQRADIPIMQTPVMPTTGSGPEELTDQQRKYLAKTYKEAVGNKFMDVLLAPPGQIPTMLDKMTKYNANVANTISQQQTANLMPLQQNFRQQMMAAGGNQDAMRKTIMQNAGWLGAPAVEQLSKSADLLFPKNEAFGSPFAMKDPKTGKTVQGVMTKTGQAIPTGAMVAPDLVVAQDGNLYDRHDPTFKIEAGSPEMKAFNQAYAESGDAVYALGQAKGAGKTVPATPITAVKDNDILGAYAAKIGKSVDQLTSTDKTAARLAYDKQVGENRVSIYQQEHPQGQIPAALENVSPKLIVPATSDYTKAGIDLAKAQQAADDMQTFIEEARKGNKIAYAYAPVEGVLSFNTGRGVTRVNMPEIRSYGAAGSAADAVQAFLGKFTSGTSIPPNVLNDMESMHKAVRGNAGKAYNNRVKVINDSYGSAYKGVDLGQDQTPTPSAQSRVKLPDPPVGAVENGYRYNGGGRYNPTSWTKVAR